MDEIWISTTFINFQFNFNNYILFLFLPITLIFYILRRDRLLLNIKKVNSSWKYPLVKYDSNMKNQF